MHSALEQSGHSIISELLLSTTERIAGRVCFLWRGALSPRAAHWNHRRAGPVAQLVPGQCDSAPLK